MPPPNTRAVPELLAELKLLAYIVTQVRVKVTFEAVAGRRANVRDFNITYLKMVGERYD